MDNGHMTVADGVLFLAGYTEAIAGVDPVSSDSVLAQYYAGRNKAVEDVTAAAQDVGRVVNKVVELITR